MFSAQRAPDLARLISAAPELLSCLERTHDILSFLVEDGLLAGRTDVIEQLEANLAIFEKAKGEWPRKG